ncbi:MAG: hypothetical protein ACXWV0_07625, partial [Flavisolibacter sp.]
TNQNPTRKNVQKADTTINTPNLQSAPVPNSIAAIQMNYEQITSQKTLGVLDSTGFKYKCNNEITGAVSYFSQKGQLRLIIHRYNEYDHHAAEEYYYVKDSALFFVYNKELLWSFDSGPQGSTRDNITEQRVYLIDKKPTRCLEKKYVIRSHAANNPSPDTVPNKEISCAAVDVMKPYQQLLKHRSKAPSDCL